jgi:hypothetical protein
MSSLSFWKLGGLGWNRTGAFRRALSPPPSDGTV